MNLFTIKTNFIAMMERYVNFSQASFEGSNRFEEIKNRLIVLHENRKSDYLFSFTRNIEGVEFWYFVLVDVDKHEEVLGGNYAPDLDPAHFGRILESGRGSYVSQEAYDKMNKFIKDFKDKLLVLKLQENKEIYYVLCDADKKSEIAESRTAEEVGRCGKILYSSICEDPPEALWDVIEKGYFDFGPTGGSINLIRSSIARGGDVSQAQVVVKEMGHIDWADRHGWTMLHHAAHCGDLNMITNLKDMNADAQVRDKICGRKPIHIAAREGHTKAVELLIDSVDDMDKSGWTPSHYAAWKGDSNTVKCLILKKANTDIRDWYLGQKPIHVAVTEGHTDIVQILLDNGSGIDDDDFNYRTLLHHSVLAGRVEMAKFLIDRNADVDITDKRNAQPIHISAKLDHAEMAELLLNHGADIKSHTSIGTPLHWAADGGSIEMVQFFVEKGADLNVVNYQFETPFDIAMAGQHFENASYLAEKMFEMFQEQDNHSEALRISEELLNIQMGTLRQDDHKTLRTQHNVALMRYKLGKYEEALESFNVILNKRQDILGPYHYETLCSKYEKGRVLAGQWKLEEAMEIFEEVFTSWQGTLGADHHRTLSVAREIAFVHLKKCEFDEALKICEDVYEKRKLSSGVNNRVTLQALQDVAIVLINKGENQSALRILKDVFEKRKACLGIDHPETISADYHIATVQRRLEEATEKEACCMQ